MNRDWVRIRSSKGLTYKLVLQSVNYGRWNPPFLSLLMNFVQIRL